MCDPVWIHVKGIDAADAATCTVETVERAEDERLSLTFTGSKAVVCVPIVLRGSVTSSVDASLDASSPMICSGSSRVDVRQGEPSAG